jgi:sugar phosphate permease
VQTREWFFAAAVIVIPLIIAVAVTMWSLDQVRYRPKKRGPVSAAAREHEAGASTDAGNESQEGRDG